MLRKILYSTCQQRVLSFLLDNPDQKYYDREISRLIKAGRASTNYALRSLTDAGLVKREKKGRMYFYYVNSQDQLIRQLKITQNVVNLRSLTERIKGISLKIVLYGSASIGTNHVESDIDLFVLTRDVKEVKDIVYKSKFNEKLQPVIITPQDFIKLKKDNQVFYKELNKGIVIYEEKI